MVNHPNRKPRLRPIRNVIEQFTGSFGLSDEIERALRDEGYVIMPAARMPKRLTRAQHDAVMACINFVQAGEWPFEDAVRPATLERAADALMGI